MPGTLYIVATPIGNLEDVTLRAIKTLSDVDIILAEDTRVTKKLLDFINNANFQFPISNFQTKSPDHIPYAKYNHQTKAMLLSYHQHSGDSVKERIFTELISGKSIALVTDAGTPGISDPGNELIDYLLGKEPELKIVPIPGASALATALSVSGFRTNNFVFLGFMPKKKRTKLFKWLKEGKMTFAFYESPHRIVKTLGVLEENFGDCRVLVARELTKLHETLYRGGFKEIKSELEKGKVKGEIVVVVE